TQFPAQSPGRRPAPRGALQPAVPLVRSSAGRSAPPAAPLPAPATCFRAASRRARQRGVGRRKPHERGGMRCACPPYALPQAREHISLRAAHADIGGFAFVFLLGDVVIAVLAAADVVGAAHAGPLSEAFALGHEGSACLAYARQFGGSVPERSVSDVALPGRL